MIMSEIRRYDVVDTDILRFEEGCIARRCDLAKNHDGPHAEVHPCSGRVFDVWDGSAVSASAVQLARSINSARDDIIEAIEYASLLRRELGNRYRDLNREKDPALYAMLHDRNIWPGEYDPYNSGFQADSESELRDEISDTYGLGARS